MKNLEKLLEYQKIDIARFKILDEIAHSDESKKMERARSEFNAAKAVVAESESTAESIIAYYESALASFEEIEKELETLDKSGIGDLEKRRALTETLEKLKARLIDLEKRLQEKNDSAEKALTKYLDGQKTGKKMSEAFAAYKARLAEIKKAHDPKLAEYEAQLEKLRPEIPADLMEKYEAVTAEKRPPAFVQVRVVDKKDYYCHCGLTLSQKAKSELLDTGFCSCETCHRVIFKPQDK